MGLRVEKKIQITRHCSSEEMYVSLKLKSETRHVHQRCSHCSSFAKRNLSRFLSNVLSLCRPHISCKCIHFIFGQTLPDFAQFFLFRLPCLVRFSQIYARFFQIVFRLFFQARFFQIFYFSSQIFSDFFQITFSSQIFQIFFRLLFQVRFFQITFSSQIFSDFFRLLFQVRFFRFFQIFFRLLFQVRVFSDFFRLLFQVRFFSHSKSDFFRN